MNGLTREELAVLEMTEGLAGREAKHKLFAVWTSAHVKLAGGNQTRAAELMGVHRNTIPRLAKIKTGKVRRNGR